MQLDNVVQTLGKELKLKIGNQGSGIANKIFVDIEFPDSILVLNGAKDDFPMPTVPALAPNPIKKAESSYQAKVNDVTNKTWQSVVGILNPDYFKFSSSPAYASLLSKGVLTNKSRTLSTSLDGNSIILSCTELLHTRMRIRNDTYTVVPLKPGEYEIKVSIICEEYSTTDVYMIPLIITRLKKLGYPFFKFWRAIFFYILLHNM